MIEERENHRKGKNRTSIDRKKREKESSHRGKNKLQKRGREEKIRENKRRRGIVIEERGDREWKNEKGGLFVGKVEGR